jgi:hypothetical protein
MSHSSAFSSLPEVTYSPDPFDHSSPIAYLGKDHSEWSRSQNDVYVTPAPLVSAMGSADTEKEIVVPTPDRAPQTPPIVWGLPFKRFLWLLCGISITLLAAAIGIGVGVGISLRKNSPADSVDTLVHTDLSTSILPTNTRFPSPSGTASATGLRCPSADHTTYSALEYNGSTTGVGTKILLLCNIDYSAIDGSVDLTSDEVNSVAECFDWCASTTGCVGASFAFYNERYTCWLKSSLAQPTVLAGFYFGVTDAEFMSS